MWSCHLLVAVVRHSISWHDLQGPLHGLLLACCFSLVACAWVAIGVLPCVEVFFVWADRWLGGCGCGGRFSFCLMTLKVSSTLWI